jgi:EmrB/QacA subfamily drug resistance transporter
MFMMLLDGTIVTVAQAEVRRGLDAGLTELQWVVDGYLLAFAVPLLAFGRLGDVYGRRRLFVLGTVLFTAASILCAGAGLLGALPGLSGAQALIVARVVQGVGAAAVLPQTLALIAALFPPERRGTAFGVASAFATLAGVVGPLAGGLIVSRWTWEGIFLLNLPIGAVVVGATLRLVPESKDPHADRRLDWPGMLLSGMGLLAMVYALIEAVRLGWGHPAIGGTLAGGVALLVAFVAWERRAPAPMLRLGLFSLRNYSAGVLAMACFNLGFHGLGLPLNVFLQGALGHSALSVGLILAPQALAVALVAPFAGRWGDRVGPRGLQAAGFAIAALGFVGLAAIAGPDVSPVAVVGTLVVAGAGTGLIVSQINAAPLRDVPLPVMGAASGLLNAVRVGAVVLGVAFQTSLLQGLARREAEGVLTDASLPVPVADRAARLVAEGRFDRLAELPNPLAVRELARLGAALQDAFAGAFALTALIAAAILLAGVGASLLLRSQIQAVEPTHVTPARPVAEPAA